MIKHGYLEQILRPCHRVGIGAFPCKKESAKALEVVIRHPLSLRILLLDGAESRWRREQDAAIVFADHTPERTGIGRANRLALIENGRTAVQKRPIDGVAVADDPADVRSRPEHF